MTTLRAFWDAAVEIDPSAPDEGRTMRFCRPDELRALWESTFDEVDVGELLVEATYADFDDYWFPFPHGIAPSGAFCGRRSAGPRSAKRASDTSARRQRASP